MIGKYVNAEELKRLLSSLSVVLVALALAALFAGIIVPGMRNANKPATPEPASPVIGEPGWLDPTEYPPQISRLIPPTDPKTLLQPSSELLTRGKKLFVQNCAQCHGETGHGDGAGAANMNPMPRNFTNAAGWTNGYDLPSVYKTLSEGIKNSSMAAFDFLSRRDRMALAHYVQSMGAFQHGGGSATAEAALSKELAAPGEKTLNKIPVSLAMAKLQNEFHAHSPLAAAPDDFSEEAQLLRRVIVDGQRAAESFAVSASGSANIKELAQSLTANAPGNGFSTRIALLGPSEWKTLREVILRRLGRDAKTM